MLVKFKNTEVELYKVRKGVVVLASGHVGHISRIGFPNNPCFDNNILCIDVESTECEVMSMSSDVEWVEPY